MRDHEGPVRLRFGPATGHARGRRQAGQLESLVCRCHPPRHHGPRALRTIDRKGGIITEPEFTKSWEELKRERPLDEERVAAYRLIIEAQSRIAASRTRAGVTDAEIDAALEACEPANPESLSPSDLYLTTIERFVTALGGRLEGAAIFGDERIELSGLRP